jgi:hypothetical protein
MEGWGAANSSAGIDRRDRLTQLARAGHKVSGSTKGKLWSTK